MADDRRKQLGSEKKHSKSLMRKLFQSAPSLNRLKKSIQKRVQWPPSIPKPVSRSTMGSVRQPPTAQAISPPHSWSPVSSSVMHAQPPSSTIDSNDDTDKKSLASGTVDGSPVHSEIDDDELERRVEQLQKRLLWITKDSEAAKKRDTEILNTAKLLISRIETMKKNVDDEGEDFKREGQICNEKIEREEIRQNQLLMDLKERVDKASDMYNDVNGQVEEMGKTLNAQMPSDDPVITTVLNSVWIGLSNSVSFIYHTIATQKVIESPSSGSDSYRTMQSTLATARSASNSSVSTNLRTTNPQALRNKGHL